jgi:hypothetical protein
MVINMNGFAERPYTRNSVLENVVSTATAAAETFDLYTVPTGYDMFLRWQSAMNGNRAGGNMLFQVKRGATIYRLDSTVAYAAATPYGIQPMIHLAAGDIIQVRLTGMVANDTITSAIFGELLPVGGWG